jgi:NhaA family Na+:H+ antiporter
LLAALAALVWANLPGDSYNDFWNTHVVIDLDRVELDLSLIHWVNDGLMAIFFFVVGLEIKRELVKGELADPQKAALPVAAAIGGMVVPALVYTAFNARGEGADGWGIPMATDIAFAVGVLSLLGPRVPLALKVFLLALAIADDIGAIVVIAVFYTEDIDPTWLAVAAATFAGVAAMGRFGVRAVYIYVAVGVFAWLAVYESGVHATIAGVVLGLLTPVYAYYEDEHVQARVLALAEDLRQADTREGNEIEESTLRGLEELSRGSQPVSDRLEHALHPWTSYLIIPVFALANAGVELGGGAIADAVQSPIAVGAALGLVAGKPVGIALASLVAVRIGFAALPEGVDWKMLVATGMIAGIGFTVSLFIAGLAFDAADLVDEAKIGILGGSAFIGLAGVLALRWLSRDAQSGVGAKREEASRL